MTVFDNMAFGLKLRHFSKAEIKQRVAEAARIVDLQDLLERKPKALSGGQRQRVAVGRAIVRHPKVFLFDEPLSNLDAKLRVQMRFEIAKLHRELNATMIYVTHDQVEAMTMADRIVVMNKGLVQQVDTPLNLYNHPVNKFVAGFIGSPSMNFLEGTINEASIFTSTQTLSVVLQNNHLKNRPVTLGIRPEDIHAQKGLETARYQPFEALIEMTEPMGNETFLHFHLGKTKMVARVKPETAPQVGERAPLYIDSEKLHFFDAVTEEVIN
jgi:multiple sugar transport system ATP-binding protein